MNGKLGFLVSVALAIAAFALVIVLTGDDEEAPSGNSGGHAPDYDQALAGAPPPLARLHDQANELLPGELDAFDRRRAELEGFPVVANLWASWCGPCRFEFPHFQSLGAKYGKRVAFIGVDSDDSEEAAATFLSEFPVPFPSYSDPDREIWDDLGVLGLPATAFYDDSGELQFLKQGAYAEESELRADIQRFALRGR